MKWKIIVVDDHQLVLDGLTRIIKAEPDFELIATASDGKKLLQILSQLSVQPDIILMDIDMPLINGIDTTKAIKKSFAEIKIILLTMHDESVYYNKVVASQADGVIMKTITQVELLAALRKVCNGGSLLNEGNKKKGVERTAINSNDSKLTEREIEILKKIALGMSNSEISKQLGISIRTVDTHRTNLKKKLAVNGIAGLVRYAYQQGLLT